MPRTKPTTKLGVYGQNDINPEKAVELYVESKLQNKNYVKEPYYWDIAREGIEFSAIQNERETIEWAKLQAEMRDKAKVDSRLNEKRIDEMYKVQETLRQKFISVNDFIRECEEKEKKAEEKIDAEVELHKKMEVEIDEIKCNAKILTEFHQQLKKTTEEFRPYESVIEEVVAQSKLYKNVKDLIDRCDALMIAQDEIGEVKEEKLKQIEELRKKMVIALNEASLEVMGLNNQLAELERCYNNSRAECLKWEKILAATKDVIIDKETVTFRLLDQIQQLYGLFCKRNGEPIQFNRNQINEQLDYIKNEIEFMQEVIAVSNDMMINEKKSLIAQQGSMKNSAKKN